MAHVKSCGFDPNATVKYLRGKHIALFITATFILLGGACGLHCCSLLLAVVTLSSKQENLQVGKKPNAMLVP